MTTHIKLKINSRTVMDLIWNQEGAWEEAEVVAQAVVAIQAAAATAPLTPHLSI